MNITKVMDFFCWFLKELKLKHNITDPSRVEHQSFLVCVIGVVGSFKTKQKECCSGPHQVLLNEDCLNKPQFTLYQLSFLQVTTEADI